MIVIPEQYVINVLYENIYKISYNKYNKLALKNTRIANSLRLCAISLPCPDDLPVGIMLCMSINKDEKLLNFAENIYNIIK